MDDVVEPGAGADCRCPRFLVKVAEDMRRRGRTAEGKAAVESDAICEPVGVGGVAVGASFAGVYCRFFAPSVGCTDEELGGWSRIDQGVCTKNGIIVTRSQCLVKERVESSCMYCM